MKAYVICEGGSDLDILERLLSGEPALDTKVLTVHGRSAVLSLSRTLLVTKGLPAVVVVDADTEPPERVRGAVETGLLQVAPPDRWKCVVFAPDIETELLLALPAQARQGTKTKAERRGALQTCLENPAMREAVRALPKVRDAVDFIRRWNGEGSVSPTV